jgi:hypothetical protein
VEFFSKGGSSTVQNSQFWHPDFFGIFLDAAGDTMLIRNTTVSDASAALYLEPNGTVIARNSVFMHSETGMCVNGATIDADSACYFYDNDTGIFFYNSNSSSVIRHCGIGENANSAMYCDNASSPLIDTNAIGFNGSGIYCTNGSSPVIQRNSIQASNAAVTGGSSSYPDVGHASPTGGQSIGENNIAHTSPYIANNNGSGTIYAEKNCWNRNTSTGLPGSGSFTGTVDYDPAIPYCTFARWDEGDPIVVPPLLTYPITELPAPEGAKLGPTALVAIVPNPFNPTTTIHYNLAKGERVDIKVYDVSGRLVQELANGMQHAGPQSVVWTGTDRRGAHVASGVYFVRMVAGREVFTRKMVMLK